MKITSPLYVVFIIAFINTSCNYREKLTEKKDRGPLMEISREHFGTVDGEPVYLYTLKNKNGMEVSITNYGGIVTSIGVPDKNGKLRDVVLGFDTLDKYLAGHPYFGCIAGRYANRIARGQFNLKGEKYQLATNNGPHHLHGGNKGFDKRVWDAKEHAGQDSVSLVLNLTSPDGEEGYPGNLEVRATYTLDNDDALTISYRAVTDQATPVNLTNHSYFNLKGAGNGDVLGHMLWIDADKYTVVDETLIPTGALRDVEGTPMDFRTPTAIGARIEQVEGGYDHNYVLNTGGSMKKIAEASAPESGIKLEVYTSQPGVQFYSGNFLDGSDTGKGGKPYYKHYGFCLETQHFPDSPNQPDFPSTILEPGDVYEHQTRYRISK
ncbi:MAG: aldose epimerase family protein [Bacteroidales bacterium]